MKLCRNCVHVRLSLTVRIAWFLFGWFLVLTDRTASPWIFARCARALYVFPVDPVTGKQPPSDLMMCSTARSGRRQTSCGPEARYYSEKETT